METLTHDWRSPATPHRPLLTLPFWGLGRSPPEGGNFGLEKSPGLPSRRYRHPSTWVEAPFQTPPPIAKTAPATRQSAPPPSIIPYNSRGGRRAALFYIFPALNFKLHLFHLFQNILDFIARPGSSYCFPAEFPHALIIILIGLIIPHPPPPGKISPDNFGRTRPPPPDNFPYPRPTPSRGVTTSREGKGWS